jgi:hypothetical protein
MDTVIILSFFAVNMIVKIITIFSELGSILVNF